MKRLLCVLLILFLPLTASAETLKTTLGVPDHVNLSFTTNTGVTIINVNADVEMPDIESVTVYDYAPTRVSEEQALAMARALGLEEIKDVWYEWYTEENFGSIYADYTGEFFNSWDMYRADTSKWIFSAISYVWHGKPFGGHIYYRFNDTRIEYNRLFALHPYGTLPENCKYSREQARQMALDLAAQIAPDYVLAQEGVIAGQQYITGDTPEEMAANWDDDLFIPTGYKFIFNRMVDGIPMTVARPLQKAGDWDPYGDYIGGEYMPNLENESLTVVISDVGFQEVELLNPFAMGEVIEGNPDLLPFESILEILRSVLPLKMLTFEGDANQEEYRVEIDRVTFGYMRVLKPDAPREYILVPVWDFFGNKLACRRGADGQFETYMTNDSDRSFLTIDARTGLVIDREYGY